MKTAPSSPTVKAQNPDCEMHTALTLPVWRQTFAHLLSSSTSLFTSKCWGASEPKPLLKTDPPPVTTVAPPPTVAQSSGILLISATMPPLVEAIVILAVHIEAVLTIISGIGSAGEKKIKITFLCNVIMYKNVVSLFKNRTRLE
jgi:hypothetical protein